MLLIISSVLSSRLWSYDSNDRFQTGGDRINVGEFEETMGASRRDRSDIRVIAL